MRFPGADEESDDEEDAWAVRKRFNSRASEEVEVDDVARNRFDSRADNGSEEEPATALSRADDAEKGDGDADVTVQRLDSRFDSNLAVSVSASAAAGAAAGDSARVDEVGIEDDEDGRARR